MVDGRKIILKFSYYWQDGHEYLGTTVRERTEMIAKLPWQHRARYTVTMATKYRDVIVLP